MEAEFIAWLQARIAPHADIALGIGDDAAVFQPSPGCELVVTTDLLCDGVHFEVAETPAALIGRKSLAVNLSDLAAMAARPRAAVVSVLWPRDLPMSHAQAIYEGLLQLADEFAVALIGGDTNSWPGRLVISVTAWGETTDRGPLTRSGAQVGDLVVVTGPLGGSLLGHHLTFTPRVATALDLHQRSELHAGMDISDGLALDLSRLIAASGVGAELDLSAIPISAAAQAASQASGRPALQHALSDGEDFELLLTLTATEWHRLQNDLDQPVTLIPVGRIIRGAGLWSVDAHGARAPLAPTGYLH